MSLLHTDDTLTDSTWQSTIVTPPRHLNPRRVGPRPRDVDQIVALLAIAILLTVPFVWWLWGYLK